MDPRNVAPRAGSTIWGYLGGGGHTATTGGTLTLAAGSPAAGGADAEQLVAALQHRQNNAGDWPLPVGQWPPYVLVDDGHTSIASVPFDVK